MAITRISATDLEIWRECHRRYDYSASARQNLEPKRPALHFLFGKAMHTALERYYGFHEDIVEAFQNAFDEAWIAVRMHNSFDDSLEGRLSQMRELGSGMMLNYLEWAAKEDDFEVVCTEREFEIPITTALGTKGFFVGRMDGIIRRKGLDNAYCVLEHKSYGQLRPSGFLIMDTQTALYQMACQWLVTQGQIPEIPTDSRVVGVLYNGLKKALPKPPKVLVSGGLSKDKTALADCTYALYLQAIQELQLSPEPYQEILSMLRARGNPFFYREYILRQRSEIEQTYKMLLAAAADLFREDLQIYPTPKDDCSWYCEYYELCKCETVGGDYESLKRMNFTQRPSRGKVYEETPVVPTVTSLF